MAHPVIEFAGRTFNSEVPDADGCRWNMPIPKGWTRPAQQVDIVEPTTNPGGSQAINRRKPWPLVARWIVRAPNRAAAYAAWERSQEMPGFGLDRTAVMLVRTPTPTWLRVLQTDVDVDEPIDGRLVIAEVELLALYPFKRGEIERSVSIAPGETKTLTNAGTQAAALFITTTGAGLVQLQQNTSGQVLRTRSSVVTGTVFDCFMQSVTTSAGLEIFPMGSPSEWLAIPGGTIDTPADTDITNQGAAPVDVTWYDTY